MAHVTQHSIYFENRSFWIPWIDCFPTKSLFWKISLPLLVVVGGWIRRTTASGGCFIVSTIEFMAEWKKNYTSRTFARHKHWRTDNNLSACFHSFIEAGRQGCLSVWWWNSWIRNVGSFGRRMSQTNRVVMSIISPLRLLCFASWDCHQVFAVGMLRLNR